MFPRRLLHQQTFIIFHIYSCIPHDKCNQVHQIGSEVIGIYSDVLWVFMMMSENIIKLCVIILILSQNSECKNKIMTRLRKCNNDIGICCRQHLNLSKIGECPLNSSTNRGHAFSCYILRFQILYTNSWRMEESHNNGGFIFFP